jgi:CRP/FNR family cyclic AMP-dependent transcriptional regulator
VSAAPPAEIRKSFLDRLDNEARELLLSVARPVSFQKGTRLVRHGDAARGAWLLRDGSAEARVLLPGGEELTVANLAAGGVFGEMALIEHGTCTATVSATTDLAGWYVEREDFRALVAQRNHIALRIQHAVTLALCEKLRKLNEKVLATPSFGDSPVDPQRGAGDSLVHVPRAVANTFDPRPFLPRLPMFDGWEAHEIDEIVASTSILELPRGKDIFVQGQQAWACFLVARGAVEVRAAHGGHDRRLAILGPGQLVGFMSLLEGGTHGASARTREQAVMLELPKAAFDDLYQGIRSTSTKLHRAIQRNLLVSLGHTNRQLTRLISLARLRARREESEALARAYFGQLWAESN